MRLFLAATAVALLCAPTLVASVRRDAVPVIQLEIHGDPMSPSGFRETHSLSPADELRHTPGLATLHRIEGRPDSVRLEVDLFPPARVAAYAALWDAGTRELRRADLLTGTNGKPYTVLALSDSLGRRLPPGPYLLAVYVGRRLFPARLMLER